MTPPPRLDISRADLEALLERAKAGPLSEADYQTLKAVLATLGYLTELLEDRTTTLQRLRHLLFGPRTETTRTVCPPAPAAATGAGAGTPAGGGPAAPPGGAVDPAAPRPGHGRNGAQAYAGARRIAVPHGSVQPGQRCPGCQKGKVYPQREPAYLVRIVGQAPLGATVYALARLRCNLCGEVFTAAPPAGVGPAKYDASAGSMVALLKYGSGVPFHRLEQLQGSLGIPLPAATQWEIVAEVAATLQPAYTELIRQAAQGEVLHNDDTGATILALGREPPAGGTSGEPPGRTGTFTSGIVATQAGREIALFFTGRQHAGENLADVLTQRAAALGPPIQMCDALARNAPEAFQVILANCLAHARRQFVEIAPAFPEECRVVLETLRQVYRHDATAKAEGLSPPARLAVHQERSGPLMAQLEAWLAAQVAERRVEPNSGLGKAIAYVRKHWEPLTRFLHVPGAPLDNNVAERALKKAILHRKNALFFRTERGAQVGDLFMSLIHTCQRCGTDPFHYLTALQAHAAALAAAPQDWLPWTYRDTLAHAGAAPDSSTP